MLWNNRASLLNSSVIGVLTLLFAVSLFVITASGEGKINALWLVTASACFYLLAYRTYGSFLAAKVLAISSETKVPSQTMKDGRDFVPTKKIVLFGHHFAAIAGAGPLIGPVLAAQFGYLPGFLWLLIGAVFAGATHDFIILVASVRRKGQSLAAIARAEVGSVAGAVTSVTVFLIIVIAMAGLSIVVINALKSSPWSTFTLASTVPIALFMGWYMVKFRPGEVGEATVIGLALLAFFLFFGERIATGSLAPLLTFNYNQLLGGLAVYAFIASILPVWLLLAPRDYLSSYLKIGVVLLLAIGVIFLAPEIQMPSTTIFLSGGGPIIPGEVFPFMFITIACGALSGFHALVSSGTTPKMIENEMDTKLIGFGAMLMEGFVGVMALIAATVLIPGDYFAINSPLSPETLAQMGYPVTNLSSLTEMVGEAELAGRAGGAVSLAVGMAFIFSSLPLLKGLMALLYHFAIVFEAVFILTTIDAGTRVARYILQDAAGYFHPKMRDIHWMPGVLLSSFCVTFFWAALVYTGTISTIWPIFGITNQLLAGIALGIGMVYLINRKKTVYCLVAAVPFTFIIATTVYAGYRQIFAEKFGFLAKLGALEGKLANGEIQETAYFVQRFTFKLDIALLAVVLFLSGVILYCILSHVYRNGFVSRESEDIPFSPECEMK